MDKPGIGTLNEHTLHAFLKKYCEKDTEKHEITVGRYVADIQNDSGITEIQTRGFSSLKKKLEFFLKSGKVTVVYPVAQKKRLIWVDPESGKTSAPRRSPKTGMPYEIFYELIYIKKLLCNPNLHFKIILLELDEYRLLDGWSADRKKGSTRKDRVPLSVLGEVSIDSTADYIKLLPPLPALFTLAELKKAAHVSNTLAQRMVNILCFVGTLERKGKRGRAYLYGRKSQSLL